MAVADHGGFSRAAEALGTQQSAVSRRVRALEDELGVSLFERHSNGVRLTVAGRRLLDRTRAAFAEIDRAVSNANSAGRGVDGVLGIGFLPSLVPGHLDELLETYRDGHPDVAIELFEGSSKEQLGTLFQRRIDVAFCLRGAATAECDTELLWSGSVYAAFPETRPLSGCDVVEWEILKEERFVLGRDATGLELDRLAADRIAEAGGRMSFVIHDASRDAAMRLVVLRFGLGLACDASARIGFPGVAFRPTRGENGCLSFCAVWLPGNDNPALRRFLSLARSMSAERRASPT